MTKRRNILPYAIVGTFVLIIGILGFVLSNSEDLQGQFSFDRNDYVTRGEFAQVIVNAFDLDSSLCDVRSQTYIDVPPHHPFYCGIDVVTKTQTMSGYSNGEFGPEGLISRGDSMVIFARILDLELSQSELATPNYSDVPQDIYFYESIEEMSHFGIIARPTGRFYPHNKVRWGVFKIWLDNSQVF